MTIEIELAILIASLAVLIKSSDVVIDASVKVARLIGLSELAVGFILISVATSLPELAVSISAILSGNIGLSVGNLLGSNVANLTLVFGIAAIFYKIRIEDKTRSELGSMLALSFLVLILMILMGGRYTTLLGMFFASLFLLYIWNSLHGHGGYKRGYRKNGDLPKFTGAMTQIFLSLIGIAFVILSSQFVVSSASSLAASFGISSALVGATIIAVGTSLPELAVSIVGAHKKRWNLILGNIVGSSLANITLIMGFVMIASPVAIDLGSFAFMAFFVIIVTAVAWWMLKKPYFDRYDGMFLLALYVLFLISIFV